MTLPEEFYEEMKERMKQQGWENTVAFVRGSKIGLSVETARRAFTEVPGKPIAEDQLAMVLMGLNYSIDEVREMMLKYGNPRGREWHLWYRLLCKG